MLIFCCFHSFILLQQKLLPSFHSNEKVIRWVMAPSNLWKRVETCWNTCKCVHMCVHVRIRFNTSWTSSVPYTFRNSKHHSKWMGSLFFGLFDPSFVQMTEQRSGGTPNNARNRLSFGTDISRPARPVIDWANQANIWLSKCCSSMRLNQPRDCTHWM